MGQSNKHGVNFTYSYAIKHCTTLLYTILIYWLELKAYDLSNLTNDVFYICSIKNSIDVKLTTYNASQFKFDILFSVIR